ncbi:MAG: hypothetical protein KJO34_17740, partial [Deltaproteobacteria bacterium]|nr:hypothetical protein [Deltaproteobacteria bacterium]
LEISHMKIRLVLFTLLISLSIIGCENSSKIENFEIEKQWMSLYQKEGCLTGGQHWGPGTTEGSIFREKEWQRFFSISSKTTIPFLMTRINSTEETKIHVCPFYMATEGELAVYASEHIIEKNWFESDSEFRELSSWSEKRRNATSTVTQTMLLDIQARNELKNYFLTNISD